MKKALLLMVLLAFGLMFSGCAAPPDITADDMKSASKIVVSWTWTGGLDEPDSYKVWRASTPLANDSGWSAAPIYQGSDTTYTDTAVSASTVYFYKVQAFKGLTEGTKSWPEGGSTTGIPKNPTDDQLTTLQTWEKAGTCIHTHVETYLYPDVVPPDTEHLDGTTGGDLYIDFAWITLPTLALATFDFVDFQDTCTNGLKLNGTQYAPVSIPSFNGLLRGYLDYGADGWEAFNITVKNKNSAGGQWYIKKGANPVAYFDYKKAPTQGCTCDVPATCCVSP
jgi:hypothetical protein